MPDATFDAVIIGGGNKGLLLAMYLIKYGGMSVGIFERRHEIVGGLVGSNGSEGTIRGTCCPCYSTLIFLKACLTSKTSIEYDEQDAVDCLALE